MADRTIRIPDHRLTREEWLERALETLAKEGQSAIRIEKLCHDLGVTKGSFYWHFEDRADFVRKISEYWAKTFTQAVVEELSPGRGDAKGRLWKLMELLFRGKHSRYDVAVRAWAGQEPEVAEVVRRVDAARIEFVGSLFREMGFVGSELEMRTRTFVCFHSLEHGLLAEQSERERKKLMRLRYEFFTRP